MTSSILKPSYRARNSLLLAASAWLRGRNQAGASGKYDGPFLLVFTAQLVTCPPGDVDAAAAREAQSGLAAMAGASRSTGLNENVPRGLRYLHCTKK